jgi:hypothetical protein
MKREGGVVTISMDIDHDNGERLSKCTIVVRCNNVHGKRLLGIMKHSLPDVMA